MSAITTRRTFGIGILTALALPLSGCLGSDDDGDDGDANGDGSANDDGNGGSDDGENGDANGDGADDDDTADGDDGTDDAFDLGEQYDLAVHFETEDGDPVSSGLFVTLEGNGQNWQFGEAAVVEGTFEAPGAILREGEYTITVEGDAFGTVQEEFALDGDTEFTVTLEGAVADGDREE